MNKEDKNNVIEQALNFILKANKDGMSNYRIAKDTNITERTIGNYVNGSTKPTFANAKILIDYFSGTGNVLKNISDVPQVSDPQIISLLREQINDLKDTIDRKDREINNLNQEIGRLRGILDENKIQYRQTGT